MQCTLAQNADENAAGASALRVEARSFEHGEGVKQDTFHAVSLYCRAARLGDAEAQYSLGWIYANGRGIPRDDEMAAYFFALAAHQGHQQSQNMMRFVGPPKSSPPECMQDPAAQALAEVLQSAKPDQRKVIEMLFRLAPEYGVDPLLGLAIARTESNFDPMALSPKAAQGLMQLIPETAVRFNVKKPFDPEQSIRGGLSYLRWLLAYFKGDVTLVAAAYNAGEGAVNRYKGIPPYSETQEYVRRIRSVFKKNGHPYDASVTLPSPDLAAIQNKNKM
jgi:hypothetical protein